MAPECYSACNFGSDSILMKFKIRLTLLSKGGISAMGEQLRASDLVPPGFRVDKVARDEGDIVITIRHGALLYRASKRDCDAATSNRRATLNGQPSCPSLFDCICVCSGSWCVSAAMRHLRSGCDGALHPQGKRSAPDHIRSRRSVSDSAVAKDGHSVRA
jgi:hypothetical protein